MWLGHRVLLFSTMTKLLDLLEAYLAWRRVPDPSGSDLQVPLGHLRIDGGTALEARCPIFHLLCGFLGHGRRAGNTLHELQAYSALCCTICSCTFWEAFVPVALLIMPINEAFGTALVHALCSI